MRSIPTTSTIHPAGSPEAVAIVERYIASVQRIKAEAAQRAQHELELKAEEDAREERRARRRARRARQAERWELVA